MDDRYTLESSQLPPPPPPPPAASSSSSSSSPHLVSTVTGGEGRSLSSLAHAVPVPATANAMAAAIHAAAASDQVNKPSHIQYTLTYMQQQPQIR